MNGREQNQQLVTVFQAAGHLCAIPLAQIVETMRPLAVEHLAAMPPYVLGLSVIRGASVPVIDLGQLLNGASAPSTRFILLRVAGRGIALAVEAVLGVRAVASETLQELPPLLGKAAGDLVESIGASDGAFLMVLRAARLLTDLPGVPHG